MTSILYIHGFLSSPASTKARQTEAWLASAYPELTFLCPQLSSYPDAALNELTSLVERCSTPLYVIGSSLGGFWANYLIEEKLAQKAVLVNPAVLPQTRFAEFVGKSLKSFYSDEVYTLEQSHIECLIAADRPQLSDPSRYWLMAQKGDETLDYRLAAQKYRDARQLIEDGGSHTFEGYEKWLPEIVKFFLA